MTEDLIEGKGKFDGFEFGMYTLYMMLGLGSILAAVGA